MWPPDKAKRVLGYRPQFSFTEFLVVLRNDDRGYYPFAGPVHERAIDKRIDLPKSILQDRNPNRHRHHRQSEKVPRCYDVGKVSSLGCCEKAHR